MPNPRYGVTVPSISGRRLLVDRWHNVVVDSWTHDPTDDEIDAAVGVYEIAAACDALGLHEWAQELEEVGA